MNVKGQRLFALDLFFTALQSKSLTLLLKWLVNALRNSTPYSM